MGGGVEGVTVTLLGSIEGATINKQTVTDATGRYSFSDIDKGYYQVVMSAPPGYYKDAAIFVNKSSNYGNKIGNDFALQSSTARTLSNGVVIGSIEDNGVGVWRGLPYGRPPVNALRWKAPQPEASWSNTYLAIQPGSACPQFADLLSDLPTSQFGRVIGKEDCLYLNIWAPENKPAVADRPVMFWIHGGGNTVGEAAQYTGKYLAERYGVVVVIINYRLGTLGWMRHPALRLDAGNDKDRSGNFGTLDMIRALHWVQDNVAEFGGNSNNVTIFGESAGGTDVLSLLVSPLAEGLFHQAISQSGGLELDTAAKAENFTDDVEAGAGRSSREVINDLLINAGLADSKAQAKVLQLTMSNEEIRDFMYGQTPEELLSVYNGAFGGMYTMPKIFRDGVVLPDAEAMSLFETGSYHQLPTILGTNRDESRLFMAFDPTYTTTIGGVIPIIKNKNDYLLASKYRSDSWKITGADEIARAMREHQDSVYVYRFDWDEEPAILGIGADVLLGAAHLMEVGFVFADVNTFAVSMYQPLVYTSGNKEGREFLAGAMSSYWASLALDGVPGTGFFGEQSTHWNAWNNHTDDTSSKTLVFDTEQDQGIVMTDLAFDLVTLQTDLEAEDGFSTVEIHCDVYASIFGSTPFYKNLCL